MRVSALLFGLIVDSLLYFVYWLACGWTIVTDPWWLSDSNNQSSILEKPLLNKPSTRFDTSNSLLSHSIPSRSRLTLQTAEIAVDTTALRCLDWDRNRFDIEFELKNGTTYNSFLIRGEKTALIDTSHSKFREQYVEYIIRNVDPQELSYCTLIHS